MAAQYIVTADPGSFVPGVGFVRVTEKYTAPPGHIPSRTALPVNAEAAAELKKLQAVLQADAKKVLEDAKEGDEVEKKAARTRAKTLEALAKSIRTDPVVIEQKAPVKEQGITLEQLGNLTANVEQGPGEKQTRKL